MAFTFNEDSELTNYRSGISAFFSGTKGVDYMEEYFLHDKLVCDRKVVFLRDSTGIKLEHNANNIIWSTAPPTVVGAGGGVIRYRIDKDLHWGPQWAGGTGTSTFRTFSGGNQIITHSLNPAYTAPFALSEQEYESGVPVVGSTGPKPATTIANWGSYYHRGVVDQFGDEWHSLTFADDDTGLVSVTSGKEGFASDGKEILFVVNPKTPCLTVRATGDGQFYTTPPKNYFIPKIHTQTTYFNAGTGSVTFELKSITGEDVHYRINGGSWVVANNPILNQDAFSVGVNTLEYYFTGNAAYTKTRTVVKNPGFPSAEESHGNLLWKDAAGYAAFAARLDSGRTPYSFYTSSLRKDSSFNNLTFWDNNRNLGRRLRVDNAVSCALIARKEGWSYTASGKPRSFGQYAREMLLCNGATIDPVGYEISHSGNAIPSRELYYRGYYDVDHVFSLCVAYDLCIGNFRADQVTGGITAIEDYFIRDSLAWFAFDAMMGEGNYTGQPYTDTGMWGTARHIGGLAVAITMPRYNTSYRGTSGFDGTTTAGAHLPFPDTGLTWKQVFHDNNKPLTGYPNLNYRLGIEEHQCDGSGQFADRQAYFGQPLMSHCFAMAANLAKMWGTKSFPNFLAAATKANAGALVGLKNTEENPGFHTNPWLTNHRFPEFAAASLPVMQAEADSSDQSDNRQIFRAAPAISLALFEDDWADFLPSEPNMATFLTDTFTATSGLDITAHTSDSGSGWVKHPSFASGSIVITDANRARSDSSGLCVAYSTSTPPTALQDVTVPMVFRSLPAGAWAGVCVGINTAANTLYYVVYTVASGGWTLWRNLAGAFTQLSTTYADAPAADVTRTVRVLRQGHALHFLLDGTLIFSVVDSGITAVGKVGLIAQGVTTNTTGIHFEGISGQDAAPTKLITFDGNSLTVGLNVTRSQNYPSRVLTTLGLAWEAYEFGVAGQKWSQMSADAASQIDATYNPARSINILAAWEDTNELYGGSSSAQTVTNRESYLAARRAVGWKLVGATCLPASGGAPPADFETKRSAINANWRSTSSVDALADVAANSAIGDAGDELTAPYQGDKIHLNATGYGIAAPIFVSAIQSIPVATTTTGEVQLIGTTTEDSHFGTDVPANTEDGSLTTWWASNTSSGGWIGKDAGVDVTPTRVRFTSRLSDATQAAKVVGGAIQGSASSTFATTTALGSISALTGTTLTGTYQAAQNLYEIAIPGASAFRYLRIRNATASSFGGQYSELRWIIAAGSSATARPVAPQITDPRGNSRSRPKVPPGTPITLTSLTTSAAIYYTTDGTTPTTSSALYTGPITLAGTSPVTLKAIAYDPTLSTPTSEVLTAEVNYAFRNGDFIYDEDMNPIGAQSGSILDNRARDGYWYWSGGSPIVSATQDIVLYRSSDLVNWEYRGRILTKASTNSGDGTPWNQLTRSHIIYCESTGEYVCWAHGDIGLSTKNRAAVGYSKNIESGWTWYNSNYDPTGVGYKDCNLFVDDDGTAYTVYDAEFEAYLVIARLSADYKTVVPGEFITIADHEAPVLFKRNGVYFLLTSPSRPYNSPTFNPTYQVCTGPTPLGTWSAQVNLWGAEIDGTVHDAQPTCVFRVPGKVDGYVYLGDRWATPLANSKQVFLPITFPTATTMQVSTPTAWDFSVFAEMPPTARRKRGLSSIAAIGRRIAGI